MSRMRIGRHVINIDLRVERLSTCAIVQRAWEERLVRSEALARREHWEHDVIARMGWYR
jgi:hypothetical protein